MAKEPTWTFKDSYRIEDEVDCDKCRHKKEQLYFTDFITVEKSTDWKWHFKDYPKEKNGLKVFSCFACGGGSTMGYKLAGCEVLGDCEIDPQMNEVYIKNHHPKYNYLMDIRDFNKLEDLPEELYHLDILDGSPPCTTFSMAGEREKGWGKKKKFREGQTEQTLDDLSFIFIETVNKLKPKCVIMENVEGLLLGAAWSYVIYKQFAEIGYTVNHYLCKGEHMGIPQTRHRVFFIAFRNDLNFDFDKLDMCFNYEPVKYGKIKEGNLRLMKKESTFYQIALKANDKDKSIADTRVRFGEKGSAFQVLYIRDRDIMPTLRTKIDIIDLNDPSNPAIVSKETIRNAQTFPQDYDFCGKNVEYICGMSVPPIMIKRIVNRIIDTGIFDE